MAAYFSPETVALTSIALGEETETLIPQRFGKLSSAAPIERLLPILTQSPARQEISCVHPVSLRLEISRCLKDNSEEHAKEPFAR